MQWNNESRLIICPENSVTVASPHRFPSPDKTARKYMSINEEDRMKEKEKQEKKKVRSKRDSIA